MNITVLGGTGLLGSKICDQLQRHGHDVLPASRATSVDAYSGEGLAAALTVSTSSSTPWM
ncbi:NAD-dependent epimerase/dehydratase family protein [Micrococcus luteus]|nr:NAD-dependent epimerase/dehydratase family protein [Micrococcus luteus]MCV7721952.1 NAD-dependent epimerase/dehydratase family protein [Micrococcus luteus]MCV7740504.1 NAD-dependent epimerase/dehydratase family protein [Micrococcus luteus]